MKISLVSPVFNEGNNIGEFIRRSMLTLAKLTDDYEIILVNDHSKDDSSDIISQYAKQFSQIRLVNLRRNVGQHVATFIGLSQARGQWVVLIDSDLQIAPENIDKLYNAALADENWEVISGVRSNRSGGIVRSASSWAVTKVVNYISAQNLPDPGSTFMLIKHRIVARILEHDILARNLPLLVAFMNLRVVSVPVECKGEANRASSYNILALGELLFTALLNFSSGTKTLAYTLFGGFAAIVLAVVLVAVLIIRGMLLAEPLATNYLMFFLAIGSVGMMFVVLGVIAYKIEQLSRNLMFRQTVNCLVDEFENKKY